MDLSDVAFLRSPAGRALLAEAESRDLTGPGRISAVAAVRERDAEHAAVAIDVVVARRKAEGKIRGAEGMLLTGEAVQQATHGKVARRRAERLAGRAVHDLTCSVGAELAELVRTCPVVLGSDLDPVRAAMAAHNVPGAHVAVADALRPVSRDAVLLADPARRTGGRRIHDPAMLRPPLPGLIEAAAGRELVVKCAPGLDFDALDWAGEVEVTSVDGGVREACLWPAGLSGGSSGERRDERSGESSGPVRRRATVIRADAVETLTDLEPDDVEVDAEADRYLVDPDGAIVRAGLVRHWARRHGLRQLDPRIAHLTGADVPAGYAGFEVRSRHRLDRKELKRALREQECGSLEILVRGVDVDPDALRRSLGLRGTRPAALVVTRIGSAAVAFVCGPRETRPA